MTARRSPAARGQAPDTTQDQLALGRALRGLRERADITQDQLAARLAIDPTYVSQVERGRRGVRWHTVLRFLRALEATLGDLATEIESTAGPSRSRRG